MREVEALLDQLDMPTWVIPHMRHLLTRVAAWHNRDPVPLKTLYGSDWEDLSDGERHDLGRVVRFYADLGLIPLQREPYTDSNNHWRYTVVRP